MELWTPGGRFVPSVTGELSGGVLVRFAVELREEGAATIFGALFVGDGAFASFPFNSGFFLFDPVDVEVREIAAAIFDFFFAGAGALVSFAFDSGL